MEEIFITLRLNNILDLLLIDHQEFTLFDIEIVSKKIYRELNKQEKLIIWSLLDKNSSIKKNYTYKNNQICTVFKNTNFK